MFSCFGCMDPERENLSPDKFPGADLPGDKSPVKKEKTFMEKFMELQNATKETAQEFSLGGKYTLAKVISVYDGDTVTLAWYENNETLVWKSVRLYGCDTAEIRGSSPEEKKLALEAKEFVSSKVLGVVVFALFGKFDKYGRPLVILWTPEKAPDDPGTLETIQETLFESSINGKLIQEGLALEYYGKTKKEFNI